MVWGPYWECRNSFFIFYWTKSHVSGAKGAWTLMKLHTKFLWEYLWDWSFRLQLLGLLLPTWMKFGTHVCHTQTNKILDFLVISGAFWQFTCVVLQQIPANLLYIISRQSEDHNDENVLKAVVIGEFQWFVKRQEVAWSPAKNLLQW